MTVKAFAPAKINLTLHVTGQRTDGYHLLDSLVTFADTGDWITVEKADETSLKVTGPKAKGVPTDGRNLVMQAAELMQVPARITLEKHLPAEAGIGGGSADAAATIRALAALYDLEVPPVEQVANLGADVPVCLQQGWARMRGIGDQIDRLGHSQGWPMLLINPGVSVPTPVIFRALTKKANAPMPEPVQTKGDVIGWLSQQRNDLEAPAILAEPVIGHVLAALAGTEGCLLARMSGSGATCFGLFRDAAARDAAHADLSAQQPDWWIAATQECPAG